MTIEEFWASANIKQRKTALVCTGLSSWFSCRDWDSLREWMKTALVEKWENQVIQNGQIVATDDDGVIDDWGSMVD